MAALIPSNEIKLILAAGGKKAKKLRRLIKMRKGSSLTIEQLLDQSDGHADQVCEDILQEFKINEKYPE